MKSDKEQILGIIKQLADQLPVIMEYSHEVHHIDGSVLIEQGHYDIDDNNKVVAGIQYKQNFPVMMAINHERRLRKAFEKSGKQGILDYLKYIKSLAENKNNSDGKN